MSSRIKILPENLTNKIAAGEVVERPASTVKELVENAVDAGSTEIVVEIESGGKRLIKVSDNGFGMSREDALLALERHATSKITSEEGLLGITTLGFRGEALPSIASVSRFLLSTREAVGLEGIEVYAEGGRIREVKACGMAEGTIVEVRNLFFNTPARLKFLKSNETESGHVADHLTRLALSRPDVKFTFINDGRVIFRALNGDLEERVVSVLGRSVATDLCKVEYKESGLSLSGLTGRPDLSRTSASHLYTYVNGRFVRDKVFQHAVLQAYRRFMERGRYPVAILFLSLPADDVDVNVHPTKHEVRFRDQARVHDFIISALEGLFCSNQWVRKSGRGLVLSEKAPDPANPYKAVDIREDTLDYGNAKEARELLDRPSRERCAIEARNAPSMQPAAEEQRGFFSSLTVIGQFAGEYLLCQDGDNLVIIDQHAAHERVAFERLKKEFATGEIESQGLLFPDVLDLTHGERSVVREHVLLINKLGFHLEEFGGTSSVLKAVPRLLSKTDYLHIFRDIIEELSTLGKSHAIRDLQEDILMRIACHGVLRGGKNLTLPEISSLLETLDSTGFAAACPHGRPIFSRMSRMEIEKKFKRV